MRGSVIAATILVALFVSASVPQAGEQEAQTGEPARQPFAEWLAELRVEALGQGISEETFDRAFRGVDPQPIIIERDRTQTEKVLTVDQYITRRVTPAVVKRAKSLARRHAAVLREVEKQYGVPREILVAVWGLESNFGRFSGVRPTIPALATLAWEGRRAAMFRGQLLDALTIVETGDIPIEKMRGSWAGAMGQVQFMPSSYVRYAQDVDGDGRRDIWTSLPDVFGSIAYYLKEHGWEQALPWGYKVRLPRKVGPALEKLRQVRDAGCAARRELTATSPVAEWSRAGVRAVTTATRRTAEVSLLQAGSATYLVTANYEALLSYNCAHSYALSVAALADRIGATPTRAKGRKPGVRSSAHRAASGSSIAE
jgi:membrane-bound lytic murein transglycosylase B